MTSGFTFLKKGVHVYKKNHNIMFVLLGGFTFFRGVSNYLICLKQNLIPNINVLPSHLWSVGNSQRTADNVQTVAEPLFKQHEDL